MEIKADSYFNKSFFQDFSTDLNRKENSVALAVASVTVIAGLALLIWLRKSGLTVYFPAYSPFSVGYEKYFVGKFGLIAFISTVCAYFYCACRQARALWMFSALSVLCAVLPHLSVYSEEARYILRPTGLFSLSFTILAVIAASEKTRIKNYAVQCALIGCSLFISAGFDTVNGLFSILAFCLFHAFLSGDQTKKDNDRVGRFFEAVALSAPGLCVITSACLKNAEIFLAMGAMISYFPVFIFFTILAFVRIAERKSSPFFSIISNPPMIAPATIIFILSAISGRMS